MKLGVPVNELGVIPEPLLAPMVEAALRIDAQAWDADTERQRSFHCHHETQAIPLVTGRNVNDLHQTAAWSEQWRPLVLGAVGSVLERQYGIGEIVRSCIVNLLPDATVLEHKDDTEELLLHTHRIHLPLKTSDLVDFFVERERFHFRLGHLYEFSNQVFHHVVNRSHQNRIHLIFDYMEGLTLEVFRRKHRDCAPVVWPTSYSDESVRDES